MQRQHNYDRGDHVTRERKSETATKGILSTCLLAEYFVLVRRVIVCAECWSVVGPQINSTSLAPLYRHQIAHQRSLLDGGGSSIENMLWLPILVARTAIPRIAWSIFWSAGNEIKRII